MAPTNYPPASTCALAKHRITDGIPGMGRSGHLTVAVWFEKASGIWLCLLFSRLDHSNPRRCGGAHSVTREEEHSVTSDGTGARESWLPAEGYLETS